MFRRLASLLLAASSVTAASWIASGTTWSDTAGNKIDTHGSLNRHFIGQIAPSATGAWRPKLAKPNGRYWVGLSLIELCQRPIRISGDLVGTIHAMVNGNEIYNFSELNSHAGRRGTTPIQLKLLASDTNTINLRNDGIDLEVKVDGVEIFEEDFES
ncbi:hypothetical protein SUNI508_12235 [Seiridium unicorne]|uniref:Lectin n=1 Tax=Seiridium unicorne TaxID=138068 RepID=A0ABR2UE70_9PEZI